MFRVCVFRNQGLVTRLVIGPQIWVHWTFQFPTLVKVMNFSLVLWEMITLSLEQKPGCRCRFEGSLSSFSLKGPPLTPPQQQQVHLQKLCSAKGHNALYTKLPGRELRSSLRLPVTAMCFALPLNPKITGSGVAVWQCGLHL